MKKLRGYHLLFGAAVLMVLGFCVNVTVDYFQYSGFHSAPFWVWVWADAFLWLLPALIAFTAGLVAKKKLIKKENTK